VLILIPFVVCVTVAGFAVVPSFLAIAVAKVGGKCFDYSLFRAAKEMLYIPLSYAEKTQGKAVVDILTYRVAKGAASLLLMGIIALAATGLVTWLNLLLVAGWLAVTYGIVNRYKTLTSEPESEGDHEIGES
jgi:ATP/ADP translocase